MGANPTQAQAIVLCFVAFTSMAAGFAADISYIAVIFGVGALGASIMLFLKCKPWEHKQE
jgi:hypothetical protein